MQWNLNKTIGWDSPDPSNYTVLYVKYNSSEPGAGDNDIKSKFDSASLEQLSYQKLGFQAENDNPEEKDYLFVVPKNYEKALDILVSLAHSYRIEQQVVIYERRYLEWDRWEDRALYPK